MRILIVFSTMMGTTEKVVEYIRNSLISADNQVDLCNVYDNLHPTSKFSNYEVLIVGAPTYDGELEINMKQYIDKQNPDLSKQKIAIFGLGDTMYPQYCISVDILEEWVLKNSGKLTIPSLRIDAYQLNTKFIEVWSQQIIAS